MALFCGLSAYNSLSASHLAFSSVYRFPPAASGHCRDLGCAVRVDLDPDFVLLYHPPLPELGVKLLHVNLPGTLALFGAGKKVARWNDMGVVVTFVVMANFLSSYLCQAHAEPLHISSHLIVTKTL